MKVLIADKQVLFRLGIEYVLKSNRSIQILAHVETKSEMMDSLKKFNPDILLVDFMEIDFLKTTDFLQIKELFPNTLCLIISNNDIEEYIIELLDFDIDGYLLKNCSLHELNLALEALVQGRKYFCSKVVEILYSNRNNKQIKTVIEPGNHLTKKELEIVELIAQGISYKEIADKLFISVHTAHTHRKNIFKKTGVRKSSELIRFALKNNIIDEIDYYI